MKLNSHKLSLAVSLLTAGTILPAYGAFDQWQINEVFSSADGSVQFVELNTTAANQIDLAGQTLVSSSTSQQKTLTFGTSLSGDTANKRVLIATQAFTTLTGLTPDYVIDAGFLSTTGGAVSFANGTASVTYSASQLPLNGIQSINGTLVPGTASPTNFAGSSAAVTATVYANFDVSTSILNLPVVDVPTVGIANLSFDVNLQTVQFALRNDFFLYDAGIVAGGNAAQFLPGNILAIPALPVGTELYAFKMSIVGDNPLTFGNLTEIAVTNSTPEPQPEPEPEPQPSELQQSIERGRSDYELRCAVCHGEGGGGGSSAFGPAPNLRTSGFNSFDLLRSKIDSSMPIDAPASCRDSGASTCATDTTNYILNDFQQ